MKGGMGMGEWEKRWWKRREGKGGEGEGKELGKREEGRVGKGWMTTLTNHTDLGPWPLQGQR